MCSQDSFKHFAGFPASRFGGERHAHTFSDDWCVRQRRRTTFSAARYAHPAFPVPPLPSASLSGPDRHPPLPIFDSVLTSRSCQTPRPVAGTSTLTSFLEASERGSPASKMSHAVAAMEARKSRLTGDVVVLAPLLGVIISRGTGRFVPSFHCVRRHCVLLASPCGG